MKSFMKGTKGNSLREDFKASPFKPRNDSSNSKAIKSLVSQLNIKLKNPQSQENTNKARNKPLSIKTLIEKNKSTFKFNENTIGFKALQAVSSQGVLKGRNLRFKRPTTKPSTNKSPKSLNDSSLLINSKSPKNRKTTHSNQSSPSFASINTQQCYPNTKPTNRQATSSHQSTHLTNLTHLPNQGVSINSVNTINNFNTANIKELTLSNNDPRFVQISEAILDNIEASTKLKALERQVDVEVESLRRVLENAKKPVKGSELSGLMSRVFEEVKRVYPLCGEVLGKVEGIAKEFLERNEEMYGCVIEENKKICESK